MTLTGSSFKKLWQLKKKLFMDGITLGQLSNKSGVSRQYISQAIGGRLILTDEEQTKIAKALGCEVKDLFD